VQRRSWVQRRGALDLLEGCRHFSAFVTLKSQVEAANEQPKPNEGQSKVLLLAPPAVAAASSSSVAEPSAPEKAAKAEKPAKKRKAAESVDAYESEKSEEEEDEDAESRPMPGGDEE